MYLSSEERRTAGREVTELLQQKDILLREMQHRFANSLQIIAGILILNARNAQSEETRRHLEDAHHRVLSVATVARQLHASGHGKPIELGPYLSRLCNTLSSSMIYDTRLTSLKVEADAGATSPDEAMNIGLITTELVINALKHAFPCGGGKILIKYAVDGANWRLSVSDNGVGLWKNDLGHLGSGTSIVEALAHQLDARVEVTSGSPRSGHVDRPRSRRAPGPKSVSIGHMTPFRKDAPPTKAGPGIKGDPLSRGLRGERRELGLKRVNTRLQHFGGTGDCEHFAELLV